MLLLADEFPLSEVSDDCSLLLLHLFRDEKEVS